MLPTLPSEVGRLAWNVAAFQRNHVKISEKTKNGGNPSHPLQCYLIVALRSGTHHNVGQIEKVHRASQNNQFYRLSPEDESSRFFQSIDKATMQRPWRRPDEGMPERSSRRPGATDFSPPSRRLEERSTIRTGSEFPGDDEASTQQESRGE